LPEGKEVMTYRNKLSCENFRQRNGGSGRGIYFTFFLQSLNSEGVTENLDLKTVEK
jgi:hypothetical protein